MTPNQIRARWREPIWGVQAMSTWSDFPSGSPEWIERVGMSFAGSFEDGLYNNSVRPFIGYVEVLVATRPAPWTIWPKAKPVGSIDAFFKLLVGLDWEQILALIAVFDNAKAEQLRALASSLDGDHAIRDGDRWTYEKMRERAAS